MKKILVLIFFIANMMVGVSYASPHQYINSNDTYISEEFPLIAEWDCRGLTWAQEWGKEPLPDIPFSHQSSNILRFLKKKGKAAFTYHFESVNDEAGSKPLNIKIQKKIDDGSWETFIETKAPKNTPFHCLRFTDNFIPRYQKVGDKTLSNAGCVHSPYNGLWTRNMYRLVIYNPNDFDIYLYPTLYHGCNSTPQTERWIFAETKNDQDFRDDIKDLS